MKKVAPHRTACQKEYQLNGAPPVSHHGAKTTAAVQLTMKVTRQGPTPRWVARLSMSAAKV